MKKFSNRQKLKQLFATMYEVTNCSLDQPGSKESLELLQKYTLKSSVDNNCIFLRIMKAWRFEVIENENTYQQKINNFAARNHFSNKQKFNAFKGWKLIARFNKGFPLLINSVKVILHSSLQYLIIIMIKSSLSKNVIQRWSRATRETRNILYYFEEGKDLRLVHRCFNAMRTFNLQEKLIKALTTKRVFAAWRSTHELTQYILPNKYNFQVLLSKTFRALKVRQVTKINTFKKTLVANELTKQKDSRAQKMSFYALIEYALKRKTKKLLHEKIDSFRLRLLKRKAMLSFKSYGYLKQIKQEQLKIAMNFRKRNKQLTLKIGSRFRVNKL